MAIGTNEKVVKYYELNDYELVSNTMAGEVTPLEICFDKDGKYVFVAGLDGVRTFILDDTKSRLLDFIPSS
jgi:hypothetical protein